MLFRYDSFFLFFQNVTRCISVLSNKRVYCSKVSLYRRERSHKISSSSPRTEGHGLYKAYLNWGWNRAKRKRLLYYMTGFLLYITCIRPSRLYGTTFSCIRPERAGGFNWRGLVPSCTTGANSFWGRMSSIYPWQKSGTGLLDNCRLMTDLKHDIFSWVLH